MLDQSLVPACDQTTASLLGQSRERERAACADPAQPPVVEAVGLTQVFGSTRVVDTLTLSVPAHQIYGLLGPNGAGKTTTLRVLLGLLRPTAGAARIMGHDPCLRRDVVRRHTGAVLTGARLYERATVRDNLEMAARLHGLARCERASRVAAALVAAQLQDRSGRLAGVLSAGERQRLLLACAQIHRPSLLLLDEPTATLDPAAAADLRDHLATLTKNEGVTILVVTHHLTFAEALCERVGVMIGGSLIAEGAPQALRERAASAREVEVTGRGLDERVLALVRAQPWVVEARLAPDRRRLSVVRADDRDNAPLIEVLRAGGVAIDEVRRARASLEDALLQLARERDERHGR